MIRRTTAALLREPAWLYGVVLALVGLAIFQGSVLSSDSSTELKLAASIAHGHLGSVWHDGRYTLEPSLILLPAGIADVIGGHVLMGFVASLEYLIFGGLLVVVGVRWTHAIWPGDSERDRAEVVVLATAATLLWVYVAKEPMDVLIAALLCLCVVASVEAGRIGWAGISLAALLCSRDQMLPVAIIGAAALLIPLLLHRRYGDLVRGGVPVLIAALLSALVNRARYGSATSFGPGYQNVVHYGTSVSTVVNSIVSPQGGILFFAPLCLVGISILWPRWTARERRAASSIMAVVLVLAIYLSVLFIHPSADYLDIWSWGRSCRYFVPLVPLTAFLLPRRPTGAFKPLAWVAGLIGVIWSFPVLLVPYDAQQRFYPRTSPDGPSVWRQYQLIPQVIRNSIHLVVHGHSPYHHSAYFLAFWQIGLVRSLGRASLVLSVPVTIAVIVLAVLLLRKSAASEDVRSLETATP